MSEEVGKCIKALELYKISGLENLYNYLTEIKDKEPFGPFTLTTLPSKTTLTSSL